MENYGATKDFKKLEQELTYMYELEKFFTENKIYLDTIKRYDGLVIDSIVGETSAKIVVVYQDENNDVKEQVVNLEPRPDIYMAFVNEYGLIHHQDYYAICPKDLIGLPVVLVEGLNNYEEKEYFAFAKHHFVELNKKAYKKCNEKYPQEEIEYCYVSCIRCDEGIEMLHLQIVSKKASGWDMVNRSVPLVKLGEFLRFTHKIEDLFNDEIAVTTDGSLKFMYVDNKDRVVYGNETDFLGVKFV